MKSEFLEDVMGYRFLTAAYKVGNHAMCTVEREGQRMHFLATDEHDWHGVLMVQYQEQITEEQSCWCQARQRPSPRSI